MSSAPKAKPTQRIVIPPQRANAAVAVEECLERTATILLHCGAATKDDLMQAIAKTREANSQGRPTDLLETLARHLNCPEPEIAQAIHAYAEQVATAVVPSPPLISFAARYIAPAAFYENFPELRQLGHALLSPIIYAEDSDAIGTAALNPVAASIMSEEIMAVVARRYEIRPFVTTVMLDYNSWNEIVRKHFLR
jgi:hypothetical protein